LSTSKALLLFLFCVYLFGCSQFEYFGVRNPSQHESNITITASQVLSISKSHDNFPSSSLKINPKNYIKNEIKKGLTKGKYLDIVFDELATLPEETMFKIVPELGDNGKYIIRVIHQANAFDDKVASVNLANFLQQISNRKYFNIFHEFFEMSFNAKLGDLQSLKNLLIIKKASLDPKNMKFNYKKFDVTNVGFGKTFDQSLFSTKSLGVIPIDISDLETMKAFNEPFMKEIDEQLSKLVAPMAIQKKERKALEVTRKALLKVLDKASNLEQLKSLAAAGKRKEATDLISTYLPREHMTPAEKQYWDTVLDVMRNPVDLKDRILIFRGIDDDMVYPFIENGIELEREVALKESKGILMSSVMTKNQGTWNRRMRSLQTMYDKVLNQNIETGSNEFSKSSRMTTMFHQHGMNPQGSPFLSWTPKIETAHMFGKKRASAFLVDPRLLMANYASVFTHELELLTPLITFPDEMVAIHDQTIHGAANATKREGLFLKMTKEKLVTEYGDELGELHYKKIKKIFDKHNKTSNVAELAVNEPQLNKLQKLGKFFREFFEKLFKTGQLVEEVVPASVVAEKQSCVYLIQALLGTP
jgi:hypothetical protein